MKSNCILNVVLSALTVLVLVLSAVPASPASAMPNTGNACNVPDKNLVRCLVGNPLDFTFGPVNREPDRRYQISISDRSKIITVGIQTDGGVFITWPTGYGTKTCRLSADKKVETCKGDHGEVEILTALKGTLYPDG